MGALSNGLQLASKHKLATAGVIGGAALLAGTGAAVVYSKSKKKRKKAKRTHQRFNSKSRKKRQFKPHTAGKRRDTSKRRIRFTKNGQPYIIQSDGKARFIKKKSARISRRRKGGRY